MENSAKIAVVAVMMAAFAGIPPAFGDAATSNMASGNNAAGLQTNIRGTSSWDTENIYWRNNYPTRPYFNKGRDYASYEPAYRYGMDLYNRNPGKRYEELNQYQLSQGLDANTRHFDPELGRGAKGSA